MDGIDDLFVPWVLNIFLKLKGNNNFKIPSQDYTIKCCFLGNGFKEFKGLQKGQWSRREYIRKKKIKPIIERWLMVIWQNGKKRAFIVRRTQDEALRFEKNT